MEKRMQYIEANLELIKTLLMGDKKTLTLEETCKDTGYTKSYMYRANIRTTNPTYETW